ncbi:hypothetical protein FHG87_000877 [Trinorchestia longiramus]|nr:hypothetical protein FHG87_000877 [Trinorchestia longiramus]
MLSENNCKSANKAAQRFTIVCSRFIGEKRADWCIWGEASIKCVRWQCRERSREEREGEIDGERGREREREGESGEGERGRERERAGERKGESGRERYRERERKEIEWKRPSLIGTNRHQY